MAIAIGECEAVKQIGGNACQVAAENFVGDSYHLAHSHGAAYALPIRQLNPANPRESMIEAMLDIEEGADILMVKPASAYLDIICRLRDKTDLPIAAYQVSGEYSQIHAAGQNGWLDLKATRDEALLAIKRAGADLILTYFAKDIALAE